MGIVARHVHLAVRDAARAAALGAVALVLLFSTTTSASPPVPTAQRPAARGYEAYRKRKVQADLQDALGHPGRAGEALLEAYAAYPDERTLLDAVTLFVRADRHEEGLAAAERYLKVARSPEGRELAKRHVNDLRHALSQHSAELVITADPADASVCLDEVCRPAPFTVWVKAGARRLSAHAPGLDTRSQELDVKPGAHAAVSVTLRARIPLGHLEVFASEGGAKVLVDGEEAGTTPLGAVRLPAGAHEVTVQRDGAAPWTTRVVVKPGDTTTVFAGRAVVPAAGAAPPGPTVGLRVPAAPDFVSVVARTQDPVRYAGAAIEPDVRARPTEAPSEPVLPVVQAEPPDVAGLPPVTPLPEVAYGQPSLPVVPVSVPGLRGRPGDQDPEPPDAPEPVALPETPYVPEPVALPETPDAPEPVALPETPDAPDPDEPAVVRVDPDEPPGLVPVEPPDEPGVAALPDEPPTEPGVDGPGVDEPGIDEPIVAQPGTDEPGTDEPGTDEPIVVEPTVDEPPAEPVAVAAVPDEPIDSDPDLGDPGLSTTVEVGGGARWQRITGWTAVGVGLGVLGGAIATHVLASNAVDSAAGLDSSSASYLDDYATYSDEAKKQVLMRNLLAPIGGVVVAAGIGLVVWDFLLPDDSPSVGMVPLPEGGFMLQTTIGF